jgi:uncharacterized membrane protein
MSTETKTVRRSNPIVTHEQIKNLSIAALMAALCYVGYAVFPAINASGTKVHLGNAFVVLGALLLGPIYGGLAGAVGLTLADILGGFAASAPRTFICKLLIGLIVGFIAVKLKKINEQHPVKYVLLWSIIAVVAGLAFNCVFEPSLKWLWYTLLFPNPEQTAKAIKALVGITSVTTLINAGINSAVGIAIYNVLRPALKKASII